MTSKVNLRQEQTLIDQSANLATTAERIKNIHGEVMSAQAELEKAQAKHAQKLDELRGCVQGYKETLAKVTALVKMYDAYNE